MKYVLHRLSEKMQSYDSLPERISNVSFLAMLLIVMLALIYHRFHHDNERPFNSIMGESKDVLQEIL